MARAGSSIQKTVLVGTAAEGGIVTSLAVASTGTAYSYSFPTKPNVQFGIMVQLDVSSGTPNVKVELESGFELPTTEAAADTDHFAVGQSNDCVIDTGANTETLRFYPLAPIVAPYSRIKFTGQGANPASCVVAKLQIFEVIYNELVLFVEFSFGCSFFFVKVHEHLQVFDSGPDFLPSIGPDFLIANGFQFLFSD